MFSSIPDVSHFMSAGFDPTGTDQNVLKVVNIRVEPLIDHFRRRFILKLDDEKEDRGKERRAKDE